LGKRKDHDVGVHVSVDDHGIDQTSLLSMSNTILDMKVDEYVVAKVTDYDCSCNDIGNMGKKVGKVLVKQILSS